MLAVEVLGQSELNAPVHDWDGGSAQRACHATPVEALDAIAFSAAPLHDNYTFVQNELDALQTRMMNFDDRVGEIEVRLDGPDVTLEELSKSTATLEKFTKPVNGNVMRNSKQIKKLSRKVRNGVPDSKYGDVSGMINVETRNAFAPLASECTDDKHKHTKAKRREKRSQKSETMMQTKAPKCGCNMKIIGASMVRGQAERLADRKRGIGACCFPRPSAKAEGIQKRLKGIVSKRDDVIMLLGWTNNIPTDDVATCITKIGRLVKEVERQNKSAQIILRKIPIRFDDVSMQEKIEDRHLGTKP